MKQFTSFFIALCTLFSLFSSAIPSSASAQTGELQPLDQLRALGGNWSIGDTVSSSGSGDLFALSESRANNFVFESEVKFQNRGGAASLVFFASDTPQRGSYVANIDLSAGNARI